jgi:hypothetical protein
MSYEDAVKSVKLTSIANAVQRMEHIISQGEPRSSIRGEMLAEVKHIQHIVDGMGGQVWSNPWWGDVAPSDVAIPQDWRNIRGGTSVRTWPRAQSGSIVTHDGKQWQVVVNVVWQRVSGQYADVFSVYAIIPV